MRNVSWIFALIAQIIIAVVQKTLERLQGERDAYQLTVVSLTAAEIEAIQALGNDFTAVWNHPACPMASKKQIAHL